MSKRRPSQSESRPSILVLLVLGITSLVVLTVAPLPVLDSFEWSMYDARMRLRNGMDPRPISDSIRVIGVGKIDEERLDTDLDNRQAYMELVRRLDGWGAQTVTFDIFFEEEKATDDIFQVTLDSTRMAATLGYHFTNHESTLRATGDMPTEFAPMQSMSISGTDTREIARSVRTLDDYFRQLRDFESERRRAGAPAEELRSHRHKIAWTREIRNDLLRRSFVLKHGIPFESGGGDNAYEAADVSLLTPPIMLTADSMGFANVEKGNEEVVRRVPLVYVYNGYIFPHLALQTALNRLGTSMSEVSIDWGNAISIRPVEGEPIAIPINERGEYLVNFREGEAFLQRNPSISPVVLPDLETEFFEETPRDFFENTSVFVGEVIAGGEGTDVEPIPIQSMFPMVGMHANILDNIINRDFLRMMPLWGKVAVAALLGILVALPFYFFRVGVASAAAFIVAAVYIVAEFVVYTNAGYVFEVVRPVLGIGVGLSLLLGYVIVVKDRDRRMVRDVFLRSVSPRIGEEILKNFHDEAIWGARREITVLFIDVRGYTTLSETESPEAVLELLDEFYGIASECVFRHEGQVNKFLGDAVLALFGALPEEEPNHAERGVRAGAEIQRAMHQLFVDRGEGTLRLSTGAGVNSGEATVGLVGRKSLRIEYTALGDAVNTASRLQTNAREGEVIIGERTMELMGGPGCPLFDNLGLRLDPVESIPLKGKAKPMAVFRARFAESPRPSSEGINTE